jgi:hypothetical protein
MTRTRLAIAPAPFPAPGVAAGVQRAVTMARRNEPAKVPAREVVSPGRHSSSGMRPALSTVQGWTVHRRATH